MNIRCIGFPARLNVGRFNCSDCSPFVYDNGDIYYYNGRGAQRMSYTPQVTSTVVLNDPDIVAIHVGFSHSYRGGQFWRYYVMVDDMPVYVPWSQLSDPLRSRVLAAFHKIENDICWMKCPGRLKKDRVSKVELTTITYDNAGNPIGYKWLYAPKYTPTLTSPTMGTVWVSNSLTANIPPAENNSFGIYAAKSPRSPILTGYAVLGSALVKLMLSGTIVEHEFGVRAEHATIVEVMEVIQ